MNTTVADIARLVGGTVHGDGHVRITGVNGIREARPGDVTFVRSGRYRDYLNETQAAAVLIAEAPEDCPLPCVVVAQPDLAFAQILQQCETEQRHHPTGIHPSAVVGENVELGEGVALDAHVVVADNCRIGAGTVIYPGCYIGRDTQIGPGGVLYPNVTIREETTIGARCIIHANTAIGSDGFGFAPLEGKWAKIPQVGRVVIGDDVEIGSNTCIDRATFGETRIGNGTKIDNLVQIGHNAEIGEDCVIAGKTGIAGSAVIGNRVRIGAQAGINGHITIGDDVTVGGRGGVTKSIPAGQTVSGFPAVDHNLERKILVGQQRLPELLRRLKQLERRVDALDETPND